MIELILELGPAILTENSTVPEGDFTGAAIAETPTFISSLLNVTPCFRIKDKPLFEFFWICDG